MSYFIEIDKDNHIFKDLKTGATGPLKKGRGRGWYVEDENRIPKQAKRRGYTNEEYNRQEGIIFEEKQRLEKMEREQGNYNDEKSDSDNLQIKSGEVIKAMANQRVHDIEETLNNDKILLNYAKKKKLNGIDGTSIKDLENRIAQKEKYISVAKDNDKEEYDKLKNDDITPMSPHFANELLQGEKKRLELAKDNLSRRKANGDTVENLSDYTRQVHEAEIAVQRAEEDYNRAVKNDTSPMSEYSDTTGTGYSDKQMSNIKIKSLPRTKEQKVMQGNYGYGWEDLEHYDKDEYKEAKENLRLYRENEPYNFKLSTRRVPMEYKQKGSKKETFTSNEIDTIKAKIDRYKKRKK